MSDKKNGISRRQFIRTATAAIAMPYVITSSALGGNGRPAASNRIVMGAIGVGGMGSGDMRAFLGNRGVQVVGVCDVDKGRRDGNKGTVDRHYRNRDCKGYLDFRELIGRGDLDAVCIATPDHWHALPAIAAARAGIDVHAQKPFARSIREGRAIADAVRRYGIVWQTGSQQRSDWRFRRAGELVINGHIGKVHKVEVGLPTGPGHGPVAPEPVPAGLDWNFWLGPAPAAPYHRVCCHYNWRWMLDYSGGQLTDWGGHHIDCAHWGLGLDYTGPVEIEGKGEYPPAGPWNAPAAYRFTCKYANGLTMIVANNLPGGVKWYGEKGWIHCNRGWWRAEPQSVLAEPIGTGEIRLYSSNNHRGNFLHCIRTRGETAAPAEIAHRSISVALLGEIAMLTGRKIKWDPEKEEIIGDAGASALLGRAYREPWQL